MSRTLRVYVIELDPAVLSDTRFRDANPHDGPKGCLYVGSTAHTAEQRYEQHKAGEFSQRGWVKRFGRCLRGDLAPPVQYSDRAVAEVAERQLAESLRREGYAVWSK